MLPVSFLRYSDSSTCDTLARHYERHYQTLLSQEVEGLRVQENQPSGNLFDGAPEDFLLDFAGYVYVRHGIHQLQFVLTVYPVWAKRLVELSFFDNQRIFQPEFLNVNDPSLTEEDLCFAFEGYGRVRS